MCLLTTNTSPCAHTECRVQPAFFAPKPQLSDSHNPAVFIYALFQLNQLLLTVAGQNSKIQSLLETISAYTQSAESASNLASDLQNKLTFPEARPYPYDLKIVGEAPNQVFKERGFSLTLMLWSNDGSCPRKSPGLHFKVCLFTQDNPPKRVQLNISGKKILRGTVEAESDAEGLVHFPNIVINEVSSHYVNDAFYLLVAHTGGLDVKPFLVDSFSVRARKPMKRMFKTSICDIDDVAV